MSKQTQKEKKKKKKEKNRKSASKPGVMMDEYQVIEYYLIETRSIKFWRTIKRRWKQNNREIDDIESIVFFILSVDHLVLLLPHVCLDELTGRELLFTVQASERSQLALWNRAKAEEEEGQCNQYNAGA